MPISEDHYLCPGCGDEVQINPNGCPRCTRHPARRVAKLSTQQKTWEQDAIYDGLDLPPEPGSDDDFDYDDWVKREMRPSIKPSGIAWHWWVVAIVLLLAFFWSFVIGG